MTKIHTVPAVDSILFDFVGFSAFKGTSTKEKSVVRERATQVKELLVLARDQARAHGSLGCDEFLTDNADMLGEIVALGTTDAERTGIEKAVREHVQAVLDAANAQCKVDKKSSHVVPSLGMLYKLHGLEGNAATTVKSVLACAREYARMLVKAKKRAVDTLGALESFKNVYSQEYAEARLCLRENTLDQEIVKVFEASV